MAEISFRRPMFRLSKANSNFVPKAKPFCSFPSEFVHKDGRKIAVALAGVWSERAQRFFIIGRDMTEQNEAEKMLASLAHFDQLTRLPNRNSLLEDLSQLGTDTAQAMCIAMFDLDGFKNVNDTLGHSIGDKLLTQVGQRIKTLTPESGRAYRLGGDEFVLIEPKFTRPSRFRRQRRRYPESNGIPF